MLPYVVIPLIAIGLLVFIIIFALYRRSTRRAKAALQAAAIEANFQEISEAKSHLTEWKGAGLSGGAKNITCAFRQEPITEGEREVILLEHRYVVSTGNSAHEVKHRVAITPIPHTWPAVRLNRENFFTRLFARFGFRGVEVEDEQFNQKWRVKTKHPEFAVLLLTPDVQMLLRDCARKSRWMIEQGYLSLLEKGSLRPEDFTTMAQALRELANTIPPELDMWQESL